MSIDKLVGDLPKVQDMEMPKRSEIPFNPSLDLTVKQKKQISSNLTEIDCLTVIFPNLVDEEYLNTQKQQISEYITSQRKANEFPLYLIRRMTVAKNIPGLLEDLKEPKDDLIEWLKAYTKEEEEVENMRLDLGSYLSLLIAFRTLRPDLISADQLKDKLLLPNIKKQIDLALEPEHQFLDTEEMVNVLSSIKIIDQDFFNRRAKLDKNWWQERKDNLEPEKPLSFSHIVRDLTKLAAKDVYIDDNGILHVDRFGKPESKLPPPPPERSVV